LELIPHVNTAHGFKEAPDRKPSFLTKEQIEILEGRIREKKEKIKNINIAKEKALEEM
jgi:hypothetical protein